MSSVSKERGLLRLRRKRFEQKLDGRSRIEQALFDGDWMTYVILVCATTIWAVELAANIKNVQGWAADAHLIVVGSLECVMLYALYAAGKTLYWRLCVHVLTRRLSKGGGQISFSDS